MGLKKLTEELNDIMNKLDDACYIVNVYKQVNEDFEFINSKKFNSFKDASDYKNSINSSNVIMNILKLDLSEEYNNPEKVVFDFSQEETGYYLTLFDEKYQIYPIDNRKDNITNAILEFLENEYRYESDKEINSVSVSWLNFDPLEIKGKIEVSFLT